MHVDQSGYEPQEIAGPLLCMWGGQSASWNRSTLERQSSRRRKRPRFGGIVLYWLQERAGFV
eukprot:1563006-Pleurochrysis_carterae.AAC.1